MRTDLEQIAPFHQHAEDIADFLGAERVRQAKAGKRADERPLPAEQFEND